MTSGVEVEQKWFSVRPVKKSFSLRVQRAASLFYTEHASLIRAMYTSLCVSIQHMYLIRTHRSMCLLVHHVVFLYSEHSLIRTTYRSVCASPSNTCCVSTKHMYLIRIMYTSLCVSPSNTGPSEPTGPSARLMRRFCSGLSVCGWLERSSGW